MRARIVPVLVSLATVATPALAQDAKQRCLDAYVAGQELRQAGKLRKAREQLRVCAQTVCPDLARNDCQKWSAEVDQQLASVVLDVRTPEGKLAERARVLLDGEPLGEAVPTAPIQLDPGAHTFRFEVDGAPPHEEVVVVRTGEKDRVVHVTLGASAAPEGAAPAPSGEATTRPVPPLALALAAVGVVGLGSFAYFGTKGRSDEDQLQACKPFCAESDVDAVRTKYLIADVSAGVGLVALGAAAYVFFTRPSVSSSGTAVDVAVTPRSASVVLRAPLF